MRHRKWLAVLLLVIAAALSLPVFGEEESSEEAGVYAYILNDYMLEYGIISTPTRGGTIQGEDSIFPQGVIYADLVDFDQTVEAMYRVGRSLPFELRESALGGLAATPAACAFCESCSRQ